MLDWKYAFRVALHVGRALEYAHARHVLHRNLTPQNILVRSADRTALLGDLMLAKALEGALAQQITRGNEVLGDVRYLSPEQTLGPEHVDCRSDLYSLGALVYALLTGRPPFEGGSVVETMLQIRQTAPAPPRQFQKSIPDHFQDVVLRLLAKHPEERYPDAQGLLRALERVGKYHGVST
jgi:serine/threonine-protein kinase